MRGIATVDIIDNIGTDCRAAGNSSADRGCLQHRFRHAYSVYSYLLTKTSQTAGMAAPKKMPIAKYIDLLQQQRSAQCVQCLSLSGTCCYIAIFSDRRYIS